MCPALQFIQAAGQGGDGNAVIEGVSGYNLLTEIDGFLGKGYQIAHPHFSIDFRGQQAGVYQQMLQGHRPVAGFGWQQM